MAWGKNATKKKTIGFGELNLDEENAEREGCYQRTGRGKTSRIRIKVSDVVDPKNDRQLDNDHVSALAESFRVQGQIYPILVREVEYERKGRKFTKIVLVDGAHRLMAKQYLCEEYIDCLFTEGDNLDIELTEIGANLWRKHTVLASAEMLVRWMVLAVANLKRSGQLGQKGRFGRPIGEIGWAARQLPVIGRTVDARRKIIDRASTIDRISPEGKEAARKAGFDDNQHALLEIARCGTPKAQVKKIAELAARWQLPDTDPQHTAQGEGDVESSPLQPPEESEDADESADDVKSTRRKPKSGEPEDAEEPVEIEEKAHVAHPSHPETTWESLEAMWDDSGRELWAYTPFGLRQRFMEKLRLARCKAKVDVVAFIKMAFLGWEMIPSEDLYSLAKKRGLSRAAVKNALKELGYSRKRKGHGWGSRWHRRNIDPDWKDQIPAISEKEFRAASEEENNKKDSIPWKTPQDRMDYYDS
jgi:hypothetical protein